MTKRLITEKINLSFADLDGLSPQEAGEFFSNYKLPSDSTGKASVVCYHDDVNGDMYFYVAYEREETDKEYAKRIASEVRDKERLETNKERKKKQELALLERLKKKYEK